MVTAAKIQWILVKIVLGLTEKETAPLIEE
jgi:hypothetical protein